MEKFQTRLGLDLGTDSIGWMLYRLADSGEIASVIGGGVRVFSEGRNDKNLASLNEDRRKARSMRRNFFRKSQRRNRLLQSLAEFGLFPRKTENGEIVPDYITGKALEKLDPWQLRAEGAEKKLPPFHIGRALFHLNQRRGFKSNAKIDDESDSKVIGKAREKMREARGELTVGQYLHSRRQNADKPSHERTVRARPLKVTAKGVGEYEPLYPFRDDIAEEFDRIWDTQKSANPDFGKTASGECGREIIRAIIVDQRDLKPPIVGKCPFYPDLNRAPMALPSFQQFRILNELNHLEYGDESGLHQLSGDEREQIRAELLRKERLSFDDMRKKILKNEGAKFNYEKTIRQKRNKNKPDIKEGEEKVRRKSISGDITGYKLRNALGKHWGALKCESGLLASQDKFVQILLDENQETAHKIFTDWGLSEDEITAAFKVTAGLPKGRARFSGKAIRAFIPYLEKGDLLGDAIDNAQVDGKIGKRHKGDGGKIYDELPRYQEVPRLRHLCLPRVPDDESKPENQRIPNPTVHVGLNQLRAVVNDIIRTCEIDNKSLQIALEIGRDLPVGAKGRKERERENSDNRDNNARIDERLKEFGEAAVTGRNRKKWKLWEELTKNPLDRKCVFCGDVQISAKDLVSPDSGIEIEHILPFKETLDDGYMNLTLACRACNQAKGKKDPYAAFGHDESRWLGIRKRASKLPHAKFGRFDKGALEKRKFDKDTFLPRQLPETQYLSRAALHYLQEICPDVYVMPGRLTGLLRGKWGLNSILADFRGDGKDKNINAKNREDHRHHAIDAAVVGATTRSVLQKVATAANTGMDSEQLFSDKVPWPTAGKDDFRRMVKSAVGKFVVSHKPRRHKEGKLHGETAYRILLDVDATGLKDRKNSPPYVVISHHIPVEKLVDKKGNAPALYEKVSDEGLPKTWSKSPKLRDRHNLRRRVLDWKDELGSFNLAIAKARKEGIRRVEVMQRIPVNAEWLRQIKEAVKNAPDRKARAEAIRRINVEAGSLIQISHKGKRGGGFKHYLPGGNWAYEIHLCRNGTWEGKAITTFEANARKAVADTAESLPLVMRLHRGDMVILPHPKTGNLKKLGKKDGPIITYVRNISDSVVTLAEHNDALPDQDKNADNHDRFIYLTSGDAFRVRKARKIDVSPAGLMRKKPIPANQ